MSFSEIERFNRDTRQNREQSDEVLRSGSSLDQVVKLANDRGYVFSIEDVKAFVRDKAAAKLNDADLADLAAAGGHKAAASKKTGLGQKKSATLSVTASVASTHVLSSVVVHVAATTTSYVGVYV